MSKKGQVRSIMREFRKDQHHAAATLRTRLLARIHDHEIRTEVIDLCDNTELPVSALDIENAQIMATI